MRLKFCAYFPVLIFIFSSCSTDRYIYSAAPPNIAYFKEKGESKITASYSAASSADGGRSEEYANGVNIQGAYAFAKNWAVTASYYTGKEKDTYNETYNLYDSSAVNYKRNLFDIGAGYFIPINSNKNITANLYFGIGKGKFSFTDNGLDQNRAAYNRSYQSTISKWFIQPSIHFILSEYIDFSLITKGSFIHFGNITTSYTSQELEYFSLNKIANKTIGFFEPSVNIQLGIPQYPWIKIDAAVGGTSNYHSESSRLNVRNFYVSAGLNFNFSKMKKIRNI